MAQSPLLAAAAAAAGVVAAAPLQSASYFETSVLGCDVTIREDGRPT